MRKMLPILLSVLVTACSMPSAHDSYLTTKPKIPYVEETPNPAPISEGSLWQDRPLVGDLRASRVNDLVTVKIAENTSAISKADVSQSRDGSNKVSSPTLLSKLPILGDYTTSGTTATTNKYKGGGSTNRSATFTTTITARVVKVLNNGDLIFEGYRDIQLNNESQRLYVAGMVDPRQLDSTNTIASDQVAELRVGYGGMGVVDETLKPGFISRLLNLVWPF
jgi:flagellar L-ring protein FlgH